MSEREGLGQFNLNRDVFVLFLIVDAHLNVAETGVVLREREREEPLTTTISHMMTVYKPLPLTACTHQLWSIAVPISTDGWPHV